MESGVTMTSSMVATAPQPSFAKPHLTARQREIKSGSTSPAFLSNLGKATLRGIRKCPQCGIYNGTRGLSCKNKACGIVFRDGGGTAGSRAAKRNTVEVVRVVIDGGGCEGEEEADGSGVSGSGGGAQVFSVCIRSRGGCAAQQGFVELVPTDTAIATGDGATLLTKVNLGRCFLPACRQGPSPRQARHASKPGPAASDGPCVHIKQAMECQSHATPLPLKSSVLEGLRAPAQAREELWRLATESPGPLVQRVSKSTLVVKCPTSTSHPLGLLHLNTRAGGGHGAGPKSKAKSREVQGSFHCACQGAIRGGRSETGGGGQSGAKGSSSTNSEPCLHFYACVCAFSSDDKLASEFADFISGSCNGVLQEAACRSPCGPEKSLLRPEPSGPHYKVKRLRMEEPLTAPPVVGGSREGLAPPTLRQAAQRKGLTVGGLKTSGTTQHVDEHLVNMGFPRWLASVTERIHQTMHYQFNGKPEPLVYHIPQEFFSALQHRLSLGSKKRRLPNTTTALVRSDCLPLGSFPQYTWHITNVMQVKRIFDTPELPLELTQSFVKNMDGSYSPFCCPELNPDPAEAHESYGRGERPQAIRPLELRTFLKVGTFTADQEEPTPFVLEWIPDILPRSRVGELRIGFEFGHQHGGQPEYSDGISGRLGVGGGGGGGAGAGAEKGNRNKTVADTSQLKHTQTVEILQLVL
ncbi:uncharacterized protein C2orf42 homolog [Aplochiton taeniatus]